MFRNPATIQGQKQAEQAGECVFNSPRSRELKRIQTIQRSTVNSQKDLSSLNKIKEYGLLIAIMLEYWPKIEAVPQWCIR